MSIFQKKTLSPAKRVCFRLKEARIASGINLETLAEQTRISKKYLLALEECRFDDIPFAPIYQKHFLRRYAEALELAPEPLLLQFASEEYLPPISHSNRALSSGRLRNLPALLKNLGIAALVVVVLGYLGWQVRAMIRPPELLVYSPADGYVTGNPLITIHGQTSSLARVYLNGQELPTSGGGRFEQKLTLSPGINNLTISAKTRHGKSISLTRHVIVKEDNRFSLLRRLTGI